MSKVVITGWNEGFKKIAVTKLLREKVELPLYEAKDCVDRCLDGEIVTLEVENIEVARAVVSAILQLNGIAKVEE